LALAKRLVYHQLQTPANRHRWRLRQHDAETNDGGIAAVATINPPPIDGTTPAADIRGSNNPADSRISSSTVQCEW